jgi:hypothetical protein
MFRRIVAVAKLWVKVSPPPRKKIVFRFDKPL